MRESLVPSQNFRLRKKVKQLMKKILMGFVHGYQRYISPLLPKSCRYHPTCSEYMVNALEYHGAFKGTIMGIARILRCHPFAEGGIDYVPLYFTLKRNPDPVYPGPYQRQNRKQTNDQ